MHTTAGRPAQHRAILCCAGCAVHGRARRHITRARAVPAVPGGMPACRHAVISNHVIVRRGVAHDVRRARTRACHSAWPCATSGRRRGRRGRAAAGADGRLLPLVCLVCRASSARRCVIIIIARRGGGAAFETNTAAWPPGRLAAWPPGRLGAWRTRRGAPVTCRAPASDLPRASQLLPRASQ